MKEDHKHAQYIIAWANGEEVEFLDECFLDECSDHWADVGESHYWNPDRKYRFKPKMIRCGNMEFPEPIRVAPDRGDTYYVPNISSISLFTGLLWSCSEYDLRVFDRGLCHTTQAAAEAHANALIALTEAK